MLMDMFFDVAAIRKKDRVHFHGFMQKFHKGRKDVYMLLTMYLNLIRLRILIPSCTIYELFPIIWNPPFIFRKST